MNTSLEHLPRVKQEQLQAIVKVIVRAVRPEKIILFGTQASAIAGQELLSDWPLSEYLGGVDLLIVTRRGDRRYDYELQDIIENRCRPHLSVTVLVHDIDYVNMQLSAGHYFFATLYREGILLYDAGIVTLEEGVCPDLPQLRVSARRDFERWYGQGEAFLKTARFNWQEEAYRIAIFLLHQAAEHTYQAVLLVFTGYKPCTHNLDKLRRYTNRFSIELALLFPRNDAEEERLFKLLQQGYVDARYKEDYCITKEEAESLLERVSRLLSISARVCRNRFFSLDKMSPGEWKGGEGQRA